MAFIINKNRQTLKPEGFDVNPKSIVKAGRKDFKKGLIIKVDQTVHSPFQEVRQKQLDLFGTKLATEYLIKVQPIRRNTERALFELKTLVLTDRKKADCRAAAYNGIQSLKNLCEEYISRINEAKALYDVQIQLYYEYALANLNGENGPLQIKEMECKLETTIFDTIEYENNLGGNF